MTAVSHGPLAALGGLAMTTKTLRLNEKRYERGLRTGYLRTGWWIEGQFLWYTG